MIECVLVSPIIYSLYSLYVNEETHLLILPCYFLVLYQSSVHFVKTSVKRSRIAALTEHCS